MTMDLFTLWSVIADRIRAGLFRLCGAESGAKVRIGPRCRLTRPKGVRLGTRVWLEADVWFKLSSASAKLIVGSHTFFARNCTVNVVEKVSIGSHTLFGPGCLIIDHNHGMAPDRRIDQQTCISKPVVIGSNVWCGAGAVVLAGVTIGDGAVIGANAVVINDVPSMAIMVGNPAQFVRDRDHISL